MARQTGADASGSTSMSTASRPQQDGRKAKHRRRASRSRSSMPANVCPFRKNHSMSCSATTPSITCPTASQSCRIGIESFVPAAVFCSPIRSSSPVNSRTRRFGSELDRFFSLTPIGHNEQVLERAGFAVRTIRDVTEAVASVSRRWHDARARRRGRLVAVEGREGFEGLQRFLNAVHVLSSQRRLSRYAYMAEKRSRTAA